METQILKVNVACVGAGAAPLSQFQDFQGDFKTISPEALEQLKNEIKLRGFSFPFHVWEKDGIYFLLDGHQRKKALEALLAEGYDIPELPFDRVEATDIEQAKMKLLGAASQYGKVDQAGFAEFIRNANLNVTDIAKNYQFPEFDVGKFAEKFFPAPAEMNEGDVNGFTVENGEGLAIDKNPLAVKQVNLFFNEATHPEFIEKVMKLQEVYGTENLTDTVMELVRETHSIKFPNPA